VAIRRGALRAAGLTGQYADGPDIWPSAYATAVGAARHSCSEPRLEAPPHVPVSPGTSAAA
jgi:hypothetical protein